MKRTVLNLAVAVVLACLAWVNTSSAALPAFHQTAREMEAVMSNRDVHAAVAHLGAISQITRTESGYELIVGDCKLEVEVIYVEQNEEEMKVGPAEFELQVGVPHCFGSEYPQLPIHPKRDLFDTVYQY